jgi:hypothetical protein
MKFPDRGYDREFLTVPAGSNSNDIAISDVVLRSAGRALFSWLEIARRTAMRTASASYRVNSQSRALRERGGSTLVLIAFFSAFALIAAIAFGTPLLHPF